MYIKNKEDLLNKIEVLPIAKSSVLKLNVLLVIPDDVMAKSWEEIKKFINEEKPKIIENVTNIVNDVC